MLLCFFGCAFLITNKRRFPTILENKIICNSSHSSCFKPLNIFRRSKSHDRYYIYPRPQNHHLNGFSWTQKKKLCNKTMLGYFQLKVLGRSATTDRWSCCCGGWRGRQNWWGCGSWPQSNLPRSHLRWQRRPPTHPPG